VALTQAIRRLSFRWQVTLLGTLAAVLLLAVLVAAVAALHFTKSAVLNAERRQLTEAARTLSREYRSKAEIARQNKQAPALQNPSAEPSRKELTLLSRSVLQNAEESQGGFYSSSEDALIGNSFSILPGWESGPSDSMALADPYASILQVARAAAKSRQESERVMTAANEIVIIEAVPIQDGPEIAGSAWMVKRLAGLPGANRFRAYLITAGLGTAALCCVILTLLVVRNLQSGVRKVERGLENLEQNLEAKIPTDTDPQEIRQIADAVNRLGATLREKIEHEKQIEDRLRHSERLAALGRLIAGVTHEVRNPLATIRLRLQMCQQESENPAVQDSCAIALEEAERLNEMVNRLLSFSQPVRLHTEPTDISRLIHQRLTGFHDKARQQGVRFLANLPQRSEPVHLDQNRMAQVFDNLIQNAIEAMEERGGTLAVNVTSQGNGTAGAREFCIEFNDTGKGIRSDTVGRVFDPFFTTKPTGTGLGLSICHELVRAHGGEIRILSAEGRGTTVRIILSTRNGDGEGARA
jgi:signal transduction histidine kinase